MNEGFTRFLLFAFLFFPFFCFSQGEWNNWRFGWYSGLDFSSGVPQPIPLTPMTEAAGSSASVSDSAGNLLFYSDGFYVFDRNNNVMPNGSGLIGCYNNPQPVYAVPKLGDNNKYFLFTVGPKIGTNAYIGLAYSVIDMTLNGGLGDIIMGQKNILVAGGDSASIQLTGTRHANNKDIWILTRRSTLYGKDKYLAYLITTAGIITPPVISVCHLNFHDPIQPNYYEGHLRISPDGNHLICADSLLEVCTFNKNTGEVTSLFSTDLILGSGSGHDPDGVEFSNNCKYVYITTTGAYNYLQAPVFQYDLTSIDSLSFANSKVIVGYGAGQCMQMGTNGKIYIDDHIGVTDSLAAINFPNLPGITCDFQMNALVLNSGSYGNGCLPQFLKKYKAYIHHSGQCQSYSIHFSSEIWPPPDSVHWDFGDPASGPDNFSNLPGTSHIYSNTGTYTVELFVRHNDNRTDTSWQVVNILPTPQPNAGPDQTICTGDSVTFDAGISGAGCTYLWKDLGSGNTVSTSQTFRTGQAGSYSITVNWIIDNCSGSDTVTLSTTPVPSVTNDPLSKSICSGESTNIPLTSNVPGTIFHWTATLTSGNVTGYNADSGLIINQVLINSLSTAGIVVYHVTPKVGNCTGTTVDFPVTVNAGDSVEVSISASANNICEGIPVTFTATPTNGGVSPTYQWKVNGINVGTNSPTYTYYPASGDLVSCILTSNAPCASNNPATSNQVIMVIMDIMNVSVSISPSANPVCAGTLVTFTANPVNPGTLPVFQWKVNGINVGPNNPTYSYIPVNGDIITCTLSSNVTCPTGNPATSNQITMTVNPVLPVSVSITASNNPVCSGISVTYTATPVNGGTSPVFQWKVNGINAGTNSPTYSYTPVSGDQIICILTSNVACPIGNPATSNIITMNVPASPVVTFIACFDTITTINAKPFKLKGGIPLRGIYSGAGVNNGIFNPAMAGVGNHQITYTYTNAALCSSSAHSTLHTFNPSNLPCGSLITDIRDGKTYQTVKIGSQCWFAEDLNYGTEIPASSHQRDNCIPEKYHHPASGIWHPASLYQWDELMQYDEVVSNQGLCPPAWHVPTENDWNTLFAEWTNNAFAAWPLLSTGFSGFTAFLSGTIHMNKTTDWPGFVTCFWSSTSHGSLKAMAHGMNSIDPSVSYYPAYRTNAFSVRCLKD